MSHARWTAKLLIETTVVFLALAVAAVWLNDRNELWAKLLLVATVVAQGSSITATTGATKRRQPSTSSYCGSP